MEGGNQGNALQLGHIGSHTARRKRRMGVHQLEFALGKARHKHRIYLGYAGHIGLAERNRHRHIVKHLIVK